jgi:hypothetical protein
LCHFNKPDKDGDIFLSEGITMNKEIPILWNWNPNKPIGKLNPGDCEILFDYMFGNIKLNPGGIIKKMRKPTLKEKLKNPKLKRIIEEMEILEFSAVPSPPNPHCAYRISKWRKILSLIKNLFSRR